MVIPAGLFSYQHPIADLKILRLDRRRVLKIFFAWSYSDDSRHRLQSEIDVRAGIQGQRNCASADRLDRANVFAS